MKIWKILTWSAAISLVLYLLPDEDEKDKDLKKKLDILANKCKDLIDKSKKIFDKNTQKKVNQELYKVKELFKNINIINLRNSLAKTLNNVAKHLSVVEDSIRNDKNNIDIPLTRPATKPTYNNSKPRTSTTPNNSKPRTSTTPNNSKPRTSTTPNNSKPRTSTTRPKTTTRPKSKIVKKPN